MTEAETEIQKKKEKNRYILSNVYNLPSIPLVMLEVTRLLDNPMTSAAELGRVIGRDQGLVTKVLTVANSPLYGLPRRVSTIDFAIVILGFEHIKNIVIALSMIEAFKHRSGRNLDQKSYWMHSIVTATAAKRIADDLGYHFTGEAFTAGLLHDLGIPVIHKYFNHDFERICELVNSGEMDYSSAQAEVLGLKHEEIASILSQKWNLPLTLNDAILHHHEPSESTENKALACLVHLADYMTQRLSVGAFEWDNGIQLDPFVIDTLRLGDEAYLEKFILSYRELFSVQMNSIKI
ncbi:MAG: HDOD domain-containing protein [Bacteroidota bacterium]